jgi:hypothetical protein
VDFLYSLYDALVSINVPSDKARAVVDAMERDMGTILATKQDLEFQTLAVKQDVAILRGDVKQELAILRSDVKQEIAILRGDMENRFALQDQKFDTLELRLIVKLGSMMVVGFGLTIAALRLWSG